MHWFCVSYSLLFINEFSLMFESLVYDDGVLGNTLDLCTRTTPCALRRQHGEDRTREI